MKGNHLEDSDTDQNGDQQVSGQPEKSKRFGCFLTFIGVLLILYAGTVLPGMKSAGRALIYIHLLVFIGGFILLGVGLIRSILLLKSKKKK